MKNKKKSIIALFALLLVMAAFFCIYRIYRPGTVSGSKTYTLAVVDDQGTEVSYKGSTDAEYLRQVLDELSKTQKFTYSGEESQYGLYLTEVNGVKADYNANGAYFALYVNGDYAAAGVDTQPVKNGDAYKIAYEISK